MIAVIDNYDSFTYNLVQYLGELGAEVRVFRNDAVTVRRAGGAGSEPHRHLPGAGHPCRCRHLQATSSASLGRRKPTRARRLPGPPVHRRGVRRAGGARAAPDARQDLADLPLRRGLFQGVPSPFEATRYHSLIVDEPLPAELEVTAFTRRAR